jgi:hypothetical protein
MKLPIHILTKPGMDYYFATKSQYEHSKQHDLFHWFKEHTTITAANAEKRLINWIDDNEIDEHHLDNLKFYREESDKCAVLNYYAKVPK